MDGNDEAVPHRLIAAYSSRSDADQAVRAVIDAGVAQSAVSVEVSDNGRLGTAERRAEVQDEANEFIGGPGVVLPGGERARHGFAGVSLGVGFGALLGIVVGAVWAFAIDSSIAPMLRLLIPAVPAAVAGAVVGFVLGAASEVSGESSGHPERLEGDAPSVAEKDILVGVRVDGADIEDVEKVKQVLERFGPDRLDGVDAEGMLLTPRSETPP